MRIKGTCTNCGREFMPEQVVASGGHCPWCGKAFDRDYTSLLVHALQQAQRAGDEESILQPLREALRRIRRNAARRRPSRV